MAYNAKIVVNNGNSYKLFEHVGGEYREVKTGFSRKDLLDHLHILRYRRTRGEIGNIEVIVESDSSEGITFTSISNLIKYLKDGDKQDGKQAS